MTAMLPSRPRREQVLDASLRGRISRMAALYPEGRSALLPVLDLLRRHGGGKLISSEVAEASRLLGMTPREAWSAASSSPLFSPAPPGRWHLELDDSVPAFLAGSPSVAKSLSRLLGIDPGETTGDGLFSLTLSRDLGASDFAPAVRVSDRLFGPLDPAGTATLAAALAGGKLPRSRPPLRTGTACSLLLEGARRDAPADVAAYLSRGGYGALARARNMSRERIRDMTDRSGLRGRGGGDFPTAAKWRSVGRGRPVYLVCNADEGEPGTFKDRILIEERPHLVLEGIAISARAVGAETCFIYLRGSYRRGGALLAEALAGARRAGLFDGLNIIIHFGAGSYICGEETALLASLEGRRGVPASKPPYPTEKGLYGRPTVVNNVETLAALPLIFSRGPEHFRRWRPRLFSVSGHVVRPGLYECPEGTPLSDLLAMAGGVRGTLKGLFLGGLSQPVLAAREIAGLALDPRSCLRRGLSLGTGTVIAMNTETDLSEVAWRVADFFAAESCGQCAPCRDGLAGIRDELRPAAGAGGKKPSLHAIRQLGTALRDLPFCPAGRWSLRSLAAIAEKFGNDFG